MKRQLHLWRSDRGHPARGRFGRGRFGSGGRLGRTGEVLDVQERGRRRPALERLRRAVAGPGDDDHDRVPARPVGERTGEYQPVGLWQEIATDMEYTQSHGADLYRRSLYTYWKRTVAPPTMLTLDATTREACTVQRTRTNTPLQALALMNDVTFVEAARVLAQRLMTEINGSTADRLVQAFAALTARQPEAAELEVLQRRFSRSLEEFRNDPSSAERFIHTGESEVDTKLDACELAAFTTVTSLILNLDEVVNQN